MPESNEQFDPILDDLHIVRREMLAECGGELTSLVAEIQRRERESRRVFTTVPISREGRSTRPLTAIMEEIGRSAEEQGMTPEILAELLRDELGASDAPLAPPAS